ncbi:MAG: hypothetical protein LUD72_05240, partial [Bacteroidales bacterium]|nr:hypothetical protein [Bacteroidales bacterium]
MSVLNINDSEANRKVFESIFTLYEEEKANCGEGERFYENISGDSARKIEIRSIDRRDMSITFRISSQQGELTRTYMLGGSDETNETKIGFGEDGATWFDELRRGRQLKSPDSDWAGMRDLVASAYHRKYYSVEFYIDDNISDDSYEAECVDFVRAVGEVLREDLHAKESDRVFDFDPALLVRGTDTYYRAKLRVDATILGTGEPMPFICYVYYRYDASSGNMSIMRRSVAEQIDGAIKNNLSSRKGDRNEKRNQSIDSTNEILKRMLEQDLNGENGNETFNQCRFLTRESKDSLKGTKTTGADDEIQLFCKKIRLLSVAKVNWPMISFKVKYCGQDVYELNYNINGISLRCINCEKDGGTDNLIVENNYLKFPEGKAPDKPVCIYGSEESPKKDWKSIRDLLMSLKEAGKLDDSNLMHHLTVTPTCNRARHLGIECDRIVCECQFMKYSRGDGTEETLCKNCGYPEIVYKDPSDYTPKATYSLFHDVIKTKMVEIEKGSKCRVCGNMYEELTDGCCDTCFRAESEVTDDGLYKAYRRV